MNIEESMKALKDSLDTGILNAMGVTDEKERQEILDGPSFLRITFGPTIEVSE